MSLLQRLIQDWQARPVFLAALASCVMLCIFFFELLSDIGLAAEILYILPVMMALLLPWRHSTSAFAAAASLFSITSFVLLLGEEPSAFSVLLGFSNRVLTLVAIWCTALLGLMWIRKDQRLQEEQARLQAVIDTSADAVVTIDETGAIQSFNRAGEKLFGYREDDVLGKNVSMLAPLPHRERHDDYLQRYLSTGERRIIGRGRQVEARRRDGSSFPVRLKVGEIVSDGRRLFTGFIHDMSDQLEAERAVAKERNFIAAMLDTTQALVVVLDRQGRIIRSNKACQRLSGYDAEELVGRAITDLLPEGSESLRRFLLRPAADPAASGRWEGSLLCKNGETRLISWSTARIQDENGGSDYLVATGIDMTEWRQSEAQASELQHHLYRMGRISELGEMASAIAHELNQPITAVANYVNASRRLLESPEHKEAGRIVVLMNRAVAQTDRAGQIVRRLRQVIGRGQSELQLIDFNAVVREAAALALIDAREQNIQVEIDLDPELPLVLADATQLQQIVLNLVRNAIDAMQSVDKRKLLIASSMAEEGKVDLSVTDSGEGIDPELAKNLFMPFVSSKPDGMGIGLAICRSIIDAHQGQIYAEPAAGGGTVFHVVLPAVEKQAVVHA